MKYKKEVDLDKVKDGIVIERGKYLKPLSFDVASLIIRYHE